jgi:hypothetical protein
LKRKTSNINAAKEKEQQTKEEGRDSDPDKDAKESERNCNYDVVVDTLWSVNLGCVVMQRT